MVAIFGHLKHGPNQSHTPKKSGMTEIYDRTEATSAGLLVLWIIQGKLCCRKSFSAGSSGRKQHPFLSTSKEALRSTQRIHTELS